MKNFDRYGVLRAASAMYAAVMLRLGFFPEFVEIYKEKDPAYFRRLLEDERVVGFVSVGGLSLGLTYPVGGEQRNAFEHFGKPYLSIVGDYPFYPWVRRSQAHEFATKFSFYVDESSVDLMGQMIAFKGRHTYCPPSYMDLRYDRRRAFAKPAERDIRLLYVGSNWDYQPARSDYLKERPERAGVFDAIVEASFPDHHTPIWHHGRSVLEAHGLGFDPTDRATQALLCAANEFVSRRRRATLMRQLARHPVTFVLGTPRLDVDLHPDARVLGPQSILDTLSLCERARAVVICLPNFAYGLSERMLYAMHRGAAVVSTSNHAVEREFVAGEHFLPVRPDFADLDDRLAAVGDDRIAARLAAQARESVAERFSPETIVARHLAVVEAAGFRL